MKHTLHLENDDDFVTPHSEHQDQETQTNPEDRRADREALRHLGDERQVEEGGVVVIKVQQIDVDCGAGWGAQWWASTSRGQ